MPKEAPVNGAQACAFMEFERAYQHFISQHSGKLARLSRDPPLSRQARHMLADDLKRVWRRADESMATGLPRADDRDYICEKLTVAFSVVRAAGVSPLLALATNDARAVQSHSFADILVREVMDDASPTLQ
jgi:hypothetical protein